MSVRKELRGRLLSANMVKLLNWRNNTAIQEPTGERRRTAAALFVTH